MATSVTSDDGIRGGGKARRATVAATTQEQGRTASCSPIVALLRSRDRERGGYLWYTRT